MSENADRWADRRLTAEELAASIREGIEGRDWRFETPVPAFPPPELDPTRHLPAVSDLTKVPLPPVAGRRGRLARAASRVRGGLLRPWAEQKTALNHLVIHLMYHNAVQLAERSDRWAGRLQERVDELTHMGFEAGRRLDDLDARFPAGPGR